MQQQQNGPSHFTREKRVKVMRKGGGGGGGGGSEVRVAECGGAGASRARDRRQGVHCKVKSNRMKGKQRNAQA